MNCSMQCLLCSDNKVEFINLSKYHGTCGKHTLSTFITCIHCGSIVPVIHLFKPDADIKNIDNKEQKIVRIEIKMDAIQRPKNINDPLCEKKLCSEPAEKAEKIVFNKPQDIIIGVPVNEYSLNQDFELWNKVKESEKYFYWNTILLFPLLVIVGAIILKRNANFKSIKSLFSSIRNKFR